MSLDRNCRSIPSTIDKTVSETFSPQTMAPATWVIIGASRGIGLEFVRQLLDQGHQVIAAVRNLQTANQIWQLSGQQSRPGACVIEECDVTREDSIDVSFPAVSPSGGSDMFT